MDSLPQVDMRDFFWLCLLSGQRSGSVKAMRWDQLLLDDKLWIIPDTKNNLPQRVTLPIEAVSILELRRKEAGGSPFVFASHSKSGHIEEPKKAWAEVLRAAGIERGYLRIHDLRRTIGSFMADAGESLPAIGKALGHLSPLATAIYARLCLDAQRETHEKGVALMMANAPDYQIKALDPEQRKRGRQKA
jgi:integrase